MTLTAHLPGSVDEIGLQGLVEDGVLNLETGMNSRVDEGYDRPPAFIGQDLDVDLEFPVESSSPVGSANSPATPRAPRSVPRSS
jgi:hypothetical protein